MNQFEVFEARKRNNSEKNTGGPKETREQKEAKERERFRKLCIAYHARQDSEWNMKSYKKDKQLLSLFKRIDRGLLKPSLQKVLEHRMAYLEVIVGMGDNPRLKKLILNFTPAQLAHVNYDALKKRVQGSAEFKAVTSQDLVDGILILKKGIGNLSKVSGTGTWEVDARKYLKGDRVDDRKAAPRLKKGFEEILKRVIELKKEKDKSQRPGNN